MELELADPELLAPLTDIGRAMQEAFDPQRFLAEFSTQVQRLLPHDRLMIAYLEEGGTLSVFAEQSRRGPAVHEGRYTSAFDPGGRYEAADLAPEAALAGEAILVWDFAQESGLTPTGLDPLMPVEISLRSRADIPLRSGGRIIGGPPRRKLHGGTAGARQNRGAGASTGTADHPLESLRARRGAGRPILHTSSIADQPPAQPYTPCPCSPRH